MYGVYPLCVLPRKSTYVYSLLNADRFAVSFQPTMLFGWDLNKHSDGHIQGLSIVFKQLACYKVTS